jgi:tRNA(Ile)-lysidine synthase
VLSTMLRTIQERALCRRGDRLLVAVSGGPDSTALLHGLRVVAPRLGLTLEAATVDHGLRPASADESALVVERCQALGVACQRLVVDVRAARTAHVSWQDAARRVRLAALEQAAAAHGCAAVALGHTADDQAETILFRIVRGTGVAGLAGIPYRRGVLVRPLLDVRRSEVLAYLRRRRLPFLEDPSNADRRFARARVRHDWLPRLAGENRRVVEALLALAADARRVAEGRPVVGGRGMSRRAAATVARLAAEGTGTRRVSVAGGEVEISYGAVTWTAPALAVPPAAVIEIATSGVYRLGTAKAAPAVEVRLEGAGPDGADATFDGEVIALPLLLRSPRPGDRMRPRGGRGSRKLSDLFIDAKVPRPRRAATPVLAAADGTVLFVPGLRPAEAGRPGRQTRRWIQVWAR